MCKICCQLFIFLGHSFMVVGAGDVLKVVLDLDQRWVEFSKGSRVLQRVSTVPQVLVVLFCHYSRSLLPL